MKKTVKRRRQRWSEYERKKRQLQTKNLSPGEYETAIRALAKQLGV